MYSSVIVMMLAFLLSTPSLEEGLLFVLLLAVLFLKAKREEHLWIQEHSSYKEYQKKTKFFIPYLL
jgi:protein-S-isoprenylcysteine O-methyltransferase Ste14